MGITRGVGSATLRLAPGCCPAAPTGLRSLGGARRDNNNLQLPGVASANAG